MAQRRLFERELAAYTVSNQTEKGWRRAERLQPEALRDNRSVIDFINSRTPSGRDDNDYCVCVKSLTLMYRATR